MAEFSEIARQYNRMCESYKNTGCIDCPMRSLGSLGLRKLCKDAAFFTPDTFVRVVEQWAEEHPEDESNRHGTWVPLGHRSGYMKHPWSEDFRCSLCGYEVYVVLFSPPKCCPKCFAQMDGGENNTKDD